jgi:FtsP/CotA-like multicopper oxidase with cupredoxin domain
VQRLRIVLRGAGHGGHGSPLAGAFPGALRFGGHDQRWTWNSRMFPGIDPLVARQHDKVRIRIGNLTMTNHPIHLHGHEFMITGTDGGPTPKSTRWHEVTTDVAVGQMRQLEFVADEEGDWAFHCHKSHHTMNAMGHDVPTMIGVDHQDVLHGHGR